MYWPLVGIAPTIQRFLAAYREVFCRDAGVVYAYLPFTLAANLAHYIPAAIIEVGQILPVIARTFSLSVRFCSKTT